MKTQSGRWNRFWQKIQQIRPDQWITGARKTLWWTGLAIQLFCLHIGQNYEDQIDTHNAYIIYTLALLIGIYCWIQCPVLRIVGQYFPVPDSDKPDIALRIISTIASTVTTLLVLAASLCLLFILFLIFSIMYS